MKIALVSPTPVPVAQGGLERLLEGLSRALRERHPTDLVTLPCDERDRDGVLRGYYDFYHLDLADYDLVISYKAPAYMVRHPHHVAYLSHRLRLFYDLYEPAGAEHERMRRLIHWMDNWALDKSRLPHLFTVGETVSRRLREFGGHASTALHHPTTLDPLASRRGEYFLSVGRLHPWKRVDLIIRAFIRYDAADARLKIVGEGTQETELKELAEGDSRIEFVGKVSDERLAELYAESVATIFPPINEDMGLITFESMASGKPVLTTTDSGEPALIVEEGRTGFIADPTPESMAEKLEWIWSHRERVAAMADACTARTKEITWDRLADRLIEAGEETIDRRRGERSSRVGVAASVREHSGNGRDRIRLLVTDNQIIDPPVGGGRVRIYELYRHLPDDFATTYVGTFDYPGPAFRDQQLTPNFREVLTPLTVRHFKGHHLFHRLTRGDATVDVTMPLLGGLTPRYRRLLDRHLDGTDVLICSHPWMFSRFPKDLAIPVVYDAHNCEAAVKAPLLKGTLAGRFLASRSVKSTERVAVKRSDLILTCSEEDAETFVRIYGVDRKKMITIPNGVDCSAIVPADESMKRECKVRLGIGSKPFAIFTGSNYVPNLEAARFIASGLARSFPDILFGLIGGVGPMLAERDPAQELPGNVRVFGVVEHGELLDLYRAADFALNPMTQGSGTNIKMLDYMAAGLPILTTAVGARGLEGRNGEHWIEAATDDFVPEFGRMVGGAVDAVGRHARRLAEERYDWSGIASQLADALRNLSKTSQRPAARST